MTTSLARSRIPQSLMSHSRVLLLLVLSVVVFGSAGRPCNAEERPGAKEQAEVDSANTVLDGVYRDLMSKADPEEQRWLREAQRAWIKWRDAEANYIARHGGAVGGSGMRVDYAVAELKLINERIAVLKKYLSQAPEH
jgi:uncharacterized protein YecT (DUF1311 family)